MRVIAWSMNDIIAVRAPADKRGGSVAYALTSAGTSTTWKIRTTSYQPPKLTPSFA